MNLSYQELWTKTKENLSLKYDEETFNQTFEGVDRVVDYQNGVISVVVPSLLIKRKINTMFIEPLNNIVKLLTVEQVKFKFVTESELEQSIKVTQKPRLKRNNLNANYNFESFVLCESNRYGLLMSMKVAEQPGVFANPLYIFGGVGLGKTHLMQAIGNYLLDKDLNNKILYVQASEFIVDYSKATQNNNMQEFDEKYGDLDCLLVDDIQMLEVGKKSQQEFFKLFENLYHNKKQIVITSDCPATELKGIMDRLTSRFNIGITIDITKPSLDDRVSILKRKALESSTKEVPDDVLYFIADNFKDNIRELEGALNRVLSYSEIYNYNTIDIDIANEALDALLKYKKVAKDEDKENYENILSIIAEFYNIRINDIISSVRKQIFVIPRQIAMYILKTKFNLPYKQIGKILGGRDHSTIISGVSKIENDIRIDKELKLAIDTIIKKIN